jgi:hypothetical protein
VYQAIETRELGLSDEASELELVCKDLGFAYGTKFVFTRKTDGSILTERNDWLWRCRGNEGFVCLFGEYLSESYG